MTTQDLPLFPDSVVAKRYKQAESKIKYQIQFGIAPYAKSMLKSDIKKTPVTFKFDATTTKQIKKQFLKFETDLELDSAYLLHVGMDGPNVNKAFEMKLSLDLKKKSENIFI